jgi:[NiFe] hydrogenase diaphorase moiety small subunit
VVLQTALGKECGLALNGSAHPANGFRGPSTQTTSLIHIDGHGIPCQEGQTVLQAALLAGLQIPHLCYHPELEPIGSCRLCLVEVEGRTVSACTLPVAEGQVIQSDGPALRKLRQAVLSMLLSRGSHNCTACERTGDCRLQDAAVALAVPALESLPRQSMPPRDDSHPDVALDRGRCILCGICIQASRELDGKNLFAFAGNGSDVSLTVESPSGLLLDSDIAAEDHAVRLCPVGALTLKQDPPRAFAAFDVFDSAWDWSESSAQADL